jgi:hypothetical protein
VAVEDQLSARARTGSGSNAKLKELNSEKGCLGCLAGASRQKTKVSGAAILERACLLVLP